MTSAIIIGPTAVPVLGVEARPRALLGKQGRLWLFGNTVGVPSYNVEVRVRITADHPYSTIAVITEAGAFDRNTAWTMPLFPYVQTELMSVSTTVPPITFTGWLEE